MTEWIGTILQESDDARESPDGTVNTSEGQATIDEANEWILLRFDNCPIAVSDTIENVTLGMYFDSSSRDAIDFEVYGNDDGDSPTCDGSNNDISGRARTANFATWFDSDLGAGVKASIGLNPAIIQSILAEPDWSTGNAITLVLKGGTGSDLRIAMFSNPSHDTTLTINYNTSGTEQTVEVAGATNGMGWSDAVFLEMDREIDVADNMGWSDWVSVGLIREISVADNIGWANTDDEIIVSTALTIVVQDYIGWEDTTGSPAAGWQEISVVDYIGFDTEVNPPPGLSFQVSIECNIMIGCGMVDEQSHQGIKVLTGRRYRR